MGGTVAKVAKEATKPVVKAAQSVGLVEKPKAAPAPAVAAPAAPTIASTKQVEAVVQQREKAEDLMARRRARRGGRALLSEARLAPEAGVGGQTLGSGGMV